MSTVSTRMVFTKEMMTSSAGSELDLGWYDTDPRSGALVSYVTLVE